MKYVALLRGIAPMNPDMRNARLCAVMEELGFQNVRAVISSGNVLFESNETDTFAMEQRAEAAWPRLLGFESATIIRSLEQLRAVLAVNPFEDYKHGASTSLNVTFLKHQTKPSFELPYRPDGKQFEIPAMTDRAVYSVTDLTGSKTPDTMAWLERQFGKHITTRTWKTVQRLADKLAS